MSTDFDQYTDMIDTRDIIARIAELEEEPDLANDDDELVDLTAFADDLGSACPDFGYGATVVHEDYFEDYARQFAEDIGAIPSDTSWPCTCINWEEAAHQLRQDYTAVEYRGQTFWVR